MAIAPTNVGSGPDTIAINVSEDAYLGDAQFNLRVDGVQIGGNQMATASHTLREQQTFLLNGFFGAGSHIVTVGFFNDAFGGSPDLDRNLWLERVTSGGVDYTSETPLFTAGSQSVSVTVPPLPVSVGTGSNSITFSIAEDAYQGDAQFTISVNGVQIGGVQTALSPRSSGQDQSFVVNGEFGTGPLSVSVNFLNDAYGGTQATDRNLYIDKIERGGVTSGVNQALYFGGPVDFTLGGTIIPTGPVNVGTGPDTIVLGISEDAYQGDAQFDIIIDGRKIGATQTATASHARSDSQLFSVYGDFGPGTHSVHLQFLNDLYGGSSTTDRNLWLDTTTYFGLSLRWNSPIFSTESGSFQVDPPAQVLTGSNITSTQGLSVLNGTSGDDVITALGSPSTIYGNGGNDRVTASRDGDDTIVLGQLLDRLTNFNDAVAISGDLNQVISGDASVTLTGQASRTIAKLGTGNNTVDLQGTGNVLQVGDGQNMISMTGGSATIRVSGPRTNVQPFSNTVTFSGQYNSFSAGVNEGKYPAPSTVSISGGSGYSSFNLGWGTGTLVTDGPGNTVTFGLGTFDISPGSGNDTVIANGFPGSPVGTIRLQGTGNTVQGSGAQLTVTGGTGSGTFTFDNRNLTPPGQSTINTDGIGNVVTQIGGNAMISPGSGGDTVNIYGGQADVRFHGADNMLFLHPGQPVTPSAGPASVATLDQSTGLQVFVEPGFGSWAVSGFDPTGVVHLLGGLGGFATPDDASAALKIDGKGYAVLFVDNTYLEFSGGAYPTAKNFAIG